MKGNFLTILYIFYNFSNILKEKSLWGLLYRDQAQLSSRDQVGCERSLHEDQNPGIQGSLAVSIARQPSRRPLAPLHSWTLVFGETAQAADLITA